MSEKNAEIIFPHDWEYRIFCEAGKIDGVKRAIEQGVKEIKLAGLQLVDGGVSGSGTYRSVRLTVEVASRDEANLLGTRLKNIDGVRFIL